MSVENQVDAIMRELMARNDQARSMEAVAKDREEFAFLAEARLRAEERAFYFDSDKNEVVVSMAKEVASGQSSILRQVESKLQKETADKINFESQASFMLSNADQQLNVLESLFE
ncbi:MAG: hypothetical protein ACKPKO_36800, partial [Candidatus Fonsibacter sp.]